MAAPAKYIVHEKRRFVYMVMPKVACTSIKVALAPLFEPGADVTGSKGLDAHLFFNDAQRRGKGWQMDRTDYLRSPADYRDFFRFAFVRNPFDRLLSCWRNKLHKPHYEGWRRLKDGPIYFGMPFPEFVEAVAGIPDEAANPHYRSQGFTLSHEGALLPDFVGRFESLGEDWSAVAGRIGAPPLPHMVKNLGGDTGYRAHYDARTRRLAEERFAEDLRLLGYSF